MKPELTKRCRACQAPLAFVKGQSGKDIPLDLGTPVFEVDCDMEGKPIARRVLETFYVSHFSTCPKANEFSKGKKR